MSPSLRSVRRGAARGGEGARSCLEAVFYILDNRALDLPAVTAFVLSEKGAFKLFPLQKHLTKVKADNAREAAKAAKELAASEDGEGLPEREGVGVQGERDCPIMAAADFIGMLSGDTLTANANAIELLLEMCRDAAERLAAVDVLLLEAA